MNNKISEAIGKIDKKYRYYILVGILLFIFLLDYLILMRPQLVTLTKISPEVKILSQDMEKSRGDIEKIGFYQNEAQRIRTALAQTGQRVRSKEEVSRILEQISRIANQNNIKIDQIMPFAEDQKELLKDGKRTYFALPILVEARSGYHDLGRFLDSLEKDDLFLSLTEFSVVAGEDLRYHKLKMNLQAIVFEEE